MTLEEAEMLRPGDRVRILVNGLGITWDEGQETYVQKVFEAGEIVVVDYTDYLKKPQGFSVTISAGNGVSNVFDESDYNGWYPFEREH